MIDRLGAALGLLVATSLFGCAERRATGHVAATEAPLLAVEQTRIFPSPTVYSFGTSVAYSDGLVVVGAPWNDGTQSPFDSSGVIHTFSRSGSGNFVQLGSGFGPIACCDFGMSIALTGTTALVGAPYQLPGGRVHVLTLTGDTWAEGGAPLDVTAVGRLVPGRFGHSLALSSDTLLVGAPETSTEPQVYPGAAYVFVRDGATWTLQGPPLTGSVTNTYTYFGYAVALSGDIAAVGAPWPVDGSAGNTYVFVRSGVVWTQDGPPLQPADATPSDQFGFSVALSADRLIVGSPYADVGDSSDAGVAYVFLRRGGSWTEEARLTVPDAAPSAHFGAAVAFAGDNAVVAGHMGVGVFSRDGTTWVPQGPPLPMDTSTLLGGVGMTAALKDLVLVGAGDDPFARGVTAIVLLGGDCADDAECASGFCSDGVCCDTACSESCDVCRADLGATTDGVCTRAPAGYVGLPGCAPQACTGSSATCSVCRRDTHCPAARYCSADGSCLRREPLGSACDLRAGRGCREEGCRMCDGPDRGFCANGVCCRSACDGACDVCATALGSSADGACEPAPENSLGDPACGPRYACNGVSTNCPTRCNSDSECAPEYYCSAGENCEERFGRGEPCDPPGAAACREANCRICDGREGGFCRDGVCCDSTCEGDCEACSRDLGASADGVCTELAQDECESCPDGRCGSGGSSCSADGQRQIDTAGAVVEDCSPYRCVDGACKKACASTLDCAAGTLCDIESSRCISDLAEGSGASAGCRFAPKGKRPGWIFAVGAVLALWRRRRREAQHRGRVWLGFTVATLACTRSEERPVDVHMAALTPSQDQRLVATPESEADRYFGTSVTLTADTALVGATTSNGSPGQAYVFVRTGGRWVEQAVLRPSSGGSFGRSVALNADTALIGASGAVHIFERSGEVWSEPEPALRYTIYSFGSDVALSGDTVLVAAPRTYGGEVFVFVRDGLGSWAQQGSPLGPPDPAVLDDFGSAVALSGDTALVGAPQANARRGLAYVFVRGEPDPLDPSGLEQRWTQQAVLSAPDDTIEFGYSVAVSGDTALVGKPIGTSELPGAVYVFVRAGSVWEFESRLVDPGQPDPQFDAFGHTLALSGEVALVAGLDRVFPWIRDGNAWAPVLPPLSRQNEGFGSALGLSGDNLLVGAPARLGANSVYQGAAYAYSMVGRPCASSAECASGFCAQGVCCDRGCEGSCEVCLRSLGAAADGVCSIAAAGYAGDPACSPLACNGSGADCEPCSSDTNCPSSRYCAADGTCKGRKRLGRPCDLSEGADCLDEGCRACAGSGAGFCADGVCCDTACDSNCSVCARASGSNADGACEAAPEGWPGKPECGDGYACNGVGVTCPSRCNSDSDCKATHFCSARRRCEPRRTVGSSCDTTAGQDCRDHGCRVCAGEGGGHCADGVCCSGACDGACEVCTAALGASADGACTALPAGAIGAPPCASGETCDGSGGMCPGACRDHDDCPAGEACTDGRCAPGVADCSDDGRQELDVYGNVQRECGLFRCKDGRCLEVCTETSDCAPGNLCDIESGECLTDLDGGSGASGCGCFVSPVASPRSAMMLVLLLSGAFWARRFASHDAPGARPRRSGGQCTNRITSCCPLRTWLVAYPVAEHTSAQVDRSERSCDQALGR